MDCLRSPLVVRGVVKTVVETPLGSKPLPTLPRSRPSESTLPPSRPHGQTPAARSRMMPSGPRWTRLTKGWSGR
jgi:hypothetical protein